MGAIHHKGFWGVRFFFPFWETFGKVARKLLTGVLLPLSQRFPKKGRKTFGQKNPSKTPGDETLPETLKLSPGEPSDPSDTLVLHVPGSGAKNPPVRVRPGNIGKLNHTWISCTRALVLARSNEEGNYAPLINSRSAPHRILHIHCSHWIAVTCYQWFFNRYWRSLNGGRHRQLKSVCS